MEIALLVKLLAVVSLQMIRLFLQRVDPYQTNKMDKLYEMLTITTIMHGFLKAYLGATNNPVGKSSIFIDVQNKYWQV